MNKIQITSSELIELMSNRNNIIGQGSSGIILPFDNELIKIYYKKIFDGFYYLDEDKLINEIEIHKKVDQEMITMFPDYKNVLINKKKKLKVLESIGLVKASVFCNEYLIGLLFNYYHEYIIVSDIYEELSIKDKKAVSKKIILC